ncbi:MAG: DUF3325 family protein, partial [Burkholderiaceae bacterium]|nr:DUF3325 family protein [Burkholderiaceae bacterium]
PLLLAAGSACAAWAGMAALAFQSPNQRHRMGLIEQAAGRRRCFIAAAAALLALSLGAAIAADGAALGMVLWLCQAGMLGLALIGALPYSVAWAVRTARVAAVIGPLLLLAGSLL